MTVLGRRVDCQVTADAIFEKALVAKNIFPPSVLDSQYGERAEMTKEQVIEKTLAEMSRYWCWDDGSKSSDDSACLAMVIAELDRRLPEGIIKTCGCFKHLDAACCNICHTLCPHSSMSLVELPDAGMAWVCHNIERAIYPERPAGH
jgi:hypothetical protein